MWSEPNMLAEKMRFTSHRQNIAIKYEALLCDCCKNNFFLLISEVRNILHVFSRTIWESKKNPAIWNSSKSRPPENSPQNRFLQVFIFTLQLVLDDLNCYLREILIGFWSGSGNEFLDVSDPDLGKVFQRFFTLI